MNCSSVQHTFLFILLALLVGQGDGRWKKSNREILRDDIKLYKKMTEIVKKDLDSYYDEYSEEPFVDYFFEEIDYFQNKIDQNIKKNIKMAMDRNMQIEHSRDFLNNDKSENKYKAYNENALQDVEVNKVLNNITLVSNNRNNEWPSFEDILTAMGKKYDWKNDRWLKVKRKIKDKDKVTPEKPKNSVEHQKHNFKYRIVKLNRAKSKRNIVIAVTAVR